MSISTRDKKILLMFSGVAVFAAGYFFGYRPQMSKAEEIEKASVPLETRLNELLEMAKNKEFYVEETSKYNQEVSDYVAQFPADVKEEDGILLARDMENTLDMEVSNIGISTRDFIASLDGSTEEEIGELIDQTLSEKANEQTQEQIDEIEGTDTKAEEALADATEAAVSDAENLTDLTVLFRRLDTLQFSGTYESLKDAVDYLASRSGRMTLDSVDASFDASTGNLMGTITVNMFSMTGTGSTYTEPDAGAVALGRKDLFGTIETAETDNENNGQS
nr:hypothetical protein [uncultured Blautia sp.]